MKIVRLLLSLSVFISFYAKAQSDSLKLDISDAQRMFLSKNHQLLAANYQIGQSQAEVITAKLFDNPELSYENLLYNHETGKFLETSYATGQYNAQLSQLIKIAGKRKKTIQLAKTGVKLAETEYEEAMRNLRFQLRDLFYRAYYSNQSAKIYQQEIASSKQLLTAYKKQLTVGNVAQKDVVRIQSLLITLQSELNTLLNTLEDDLRDIKLLCVIDAETPIKLVLADAKQKAVQQIPYTVLLDSARNNRADYKLAKYNQQYSEAQLKLQKAMAIPDIEMSLIYDLKGSYPEKYTGIGIKVPIPLFNRNQGEIKKARIGINAANTEVKRYDSLLENELHNSYQTALRTEQHYFDIDPGFSPDFEQLMRSINKSFKERNLSLIEFLDFYAAYRENTLLLNQLKYERLSNREELNFVTGSNIFN